MLQSIVHLTCSILPSYIQLFGMLFKFKNLSCKLRTLVTSSYLKNKKMFFYLRYLELSETFDVTFTFGKDNWNRKFNLKRSVNESLTDFTGRLGANIQKVLMSKLGKRKSIENVLNEPDVRILQSGQLVDNTRTCKDVFFSGEKEHVIQINSIDYNAVINPPWVNSISLPQDLMTGFYAYPCKVEILFGSLCQSELVWFRSNVKGGDWEEVSRGPILYLTDEYLGRLLKLVCVPRNCELTGPEFEVQSKKVIKEGPTEMPFLSRQKYTSTNLPANSFRVVSYNILADGYAESAAAVAELFPYCPPYARNIDYRKQLLIKELIGYNADIICLQECDSRIFRHDFCNALLEFDGILSQKTGTVGEGVATFYDKRKFRLIEEKVLSLGQEIDINPIFSKVWDKIKNYESTRDKIKERNTVAHALILENLDTHNYVVVGNTHLYFHPEADHIRLIQGGMITLFLENIVKSLQENGRKTALIVCGDMNSTPDCGLYLLMTNKKAPSDLKDWSTDPDEKIEDLEFTQPFEMKSAYGTPPFTNYTEKFSGCLDYIYYQADSLDLIQVVPIPEENVLKAHTALPSPMFPSDHVSLIADFSWKMKCHFLEDSKNEVVNNVLRF